MRGCPDFYGCINGQMVLLEFKRSSTAHVGRLQEWHLKKAANAGAMAFIVNPEGWTDVYETLKHIADNYPEDEGWDDDDYEEDLEPLNQMITLKYKDINNKDLQDTLIRIEKLAFKDVNVLRRVFAVTDKILIEMQKYAGLHKVLVNETFNFEGSGKDFKATIKSDQHQNKFDAGIQKLLNTEISVEQFSESDIGVIGLSPTEFRWIAKLVKGGLDGKED